MVLLSSSIDIAVTYTCTIYYVVVVRFSQTQYNIRLDHRAHLFQNLNGAKDEVELKFEGNSTFAYNSIYDTRAVVYHGNGPSKVRNYS